jgi:hypothetical protein
MPSGMRPHEPVSTAGTLKRLNGGNDLLAMSPSRPSSLPSFASPKSFHGRRRLIPAVRSAPTSSVQHGVCSLFARSLPYPCTEKCGPKAFQRSSDTRGPTLAASSDVSVTSTVGGVISFVNVGGVKLGPLESPTDTSVTAEYSSPARACTRLVAEPVTSATKSMLGKMTTGPMVSGGRSKLAPSITNSSWSKLVAAAPSTSTLALAIASARAPIFTSGRSGVQTSAPLSAHASSTAAFLGSSIQSRSTVTLKPTVPVTSPVT